MHPLMDHSLPFCLLGEVSPESDFQPSGRFACPSTSGVVNSRSGLVFHRSRTPMNRASCCLVALLICPAPVAADTILRSTTIVTGENQLTPLDSGGQRWGIGNNLHC